MSARILATGLAATGTLGLTAGYALGQKPDDAAPVLDNMLASATGAQVAPQPNVVVVPVQPPVAASPGNGAGSGNWDSGPTQQQSSGSN